jgi:hypothetical protein
MLVVSVVGARSALFPARRFALHLRPRIVNLYGVRGYGGGGVAHEQGDSADQL